MGCTRIVALLAVCSWTLVAATNKGRLVRREIKLAAAAHQGRLVRREIKTDGKIAGDCRPCTAADTGCTHPGNADQGWCDSHCTSGANDNVCVASHCTCGETDAAAAPEPTLDGGKGGTDGEVAGDCRPCTAADTGCTHPGNADQTWCDAHCAAGVNGAGCPASHCTCGAIDSVAAPEPSPTPKPSPAPIDAVAAPQPSPKPKPSPAPNPKPKAVSQHVVCKDEFFDCPSRVAQDETLCQRGGSVASNCKKTCNYCEACTDLHELCHEYEAEGRCTGDFEAWMRVECPRSCGICTPVTVSLPPPYSFTSHCADGGGCSDFSGKWTWSGGSDVSTLVMDGCTVVGKNPDRWWRQANGTACGNTVKMLGLSGMLSGNIIWWENKEYRVQWVRS